LIVWWTTCTKKREKNASSIEKKGKTKEGPSGREKRRWANDEPIG